MLSHASTFAARQSHGRAILGVLVAGTLPAGCGEDSSRGANGDAGDDVSTVRIDAVADGSLRFDRSRLAISRGPVRIEMANPSAVPHAVAVRGDGVDLAGDTVGRGGTSRVQTELASGSYTMYCPVAAHERGGMSATLTAR